MADVMGIMMTVERCRLIEDVLCQQLVLSVYMLLLRGGSPALAHGSASLGLLRYYQRPDKRKHLLHSDFAVEKRIHFTEEFRT